MSTYLIAFQKQFSIFVKSTDRNEVFVCTFQLIYIILGRFDFLRNNISVYKNGIYRSLLRLVPFYRNTVIGLPDYS